MSHTDLARRLAEAEKTIQVLQDELLETSEEMRRLWRGDIDGRNSLVGEDP